MQISYFALFGKTMQTTVDTRQTTVCNNGRVGYCQQAVPDSDSLDRSGAAVQRHLYSGTAVKVPSRVATMRESALLAALCM